MKRIVITPVFILLVIFFLLAGSVAFYNLVLHNEGGSSLGGGFALIFALIFLFALVLEQAIVYYINPTKKVVWLVESILLLVLGAWLYFSNFKFSIG